MKHRSKAMTTIALAALLISGSGHAQSVVNLVTNGGFEDGTDTGWGGYGDHTREVVQTLEGAAFPQTPIEGDHCLHVTVHSGFNNWWGIGINFYQGGVFEEGKKYTMALWLKTRSGERGIGLKPQLAVAPWNGYSGDQYLVTMTEEWVEYHVTTPVMTETVSPADLMLHIGFGPGEFWIDGARFYEGEFVPTPLGPQVQASVLDPADGTADIARDTALRWQAGEFAVTHDVYLSDDFDNVNSGAGSALIAEGVVETSVVPGPLAFGTTYYWRVDAVNGPPDYSVFRGEVESFTTEPFSYPIVNITAEASSTFGASGPERTIDDSGMVDDLHGTSPGDMWISTSLPATIEYAFDNVYKLHELWIWNANQRVESFVGFGAKDVVIEHSLDGENWIVFDGVEPLVRAPGDAGYAHNNTVDLGGVTAQRVRLTINTVQGFVTQASLSEVRFFYISTTAREPQPTAGQVDVIPSTLLSWRAGRDAGGHDLYLGTDATDLDLVSNVAENSFGSETLDLQLGRTYYWRVDEVNETMDPSTWMGDVWSFTTADAISVDDMEGYRDKAFLEIWTTWIDGFDDPVNNGAIVGAAPSRNDFSPERTIVYGGSQSLPIHFDNTVASWSEATRTFENTMDWSKHGAQSLVLYFRGRPGNSGGQLFLKINNTKVTYDGAPSDLMHLGWNKWTIPLSIIGQSDLGRVNSLTIGIEGIGSGVLYVDEIQLTMDARVWVTPTEPSDEALVAHYAFEGDASDSTGQSPGSLFGETSFVPGVDGQALHLDGISAYVAIDGLFYDASGLAAVTVAAWIRTDTERNQIIASFDQNEYWRLEINGPNGGPGQVGWGVKTDAGVLSSNSNSRVDDNEWHLVAGVFDNGTATIYIDGYHEPSVARGSTFGTGNTRFGYIGVGSESTAFNADPRLPASYFKGDLDDVQIYHRALSAAEVAGMAGRTKPFERP